MENFLLPSKVEFQPGTLPHSGSVMISPCYHGYGTTLGNALRRVLLSSLPGAAVEYFKIKGVQHEFSTVDGMKEDVVELMLNLKQLAVKVFSDEPVTLTLTKTGAGPVTAGDITPNGSVEIINKDLVIATLTKKKTLEMEIVVGKGRGFKPVEEKDRKSYDLGTIVTDSVYTPVKDVGYHVELTRVGDITNYEKLTMNVETNGTIGFEQAIRQATQILMDHFTIVSDAAPAAEVMPAVVEEAAPETKEEVEPAAAEAMAGEGKKEKKPKAKKTSKKKDK
ncbi:MAG TPA: DNA-directed RNA polymerase subunit alpha [Patescibacteria group bacterium]|nr:DNA-directed RNA polymerase subunit alpha [Patescibacteria group bacterium]